jgi:hypothetical protein
LGDVVMCNSFYRWRACAQIVWFLTRLGTGLP